VKIVAVVLALALATGAQAQRMADAPMGARQASAEVWLYTDAMPDALKPLAPLAGKVVRENLCPQLKVAENGALYAYQVEATFSVKRTRDRSWKVDDIRFSNPSGCEALDAEAKLLIAEALPKFVEPRIDADKNGWLRLPRIQLAVD
jgi:hypothetical protein